MATLAQLAELPERLRQHCQFPGDYCAVSGFESIAKLEAIIEPDAFPLQVDAANVGKGFEPAHRGFLVGHGFVCNDTHYQTGAEAVAMIEAETNAGRYPLVSLPVSDANGTFAGRHVFIFVKHANELLLVDPAVPCVILRGMGDLEKVLNILRNRGPDHQTVHLFTYVRPKQDNPGNPQ